MYPRFQQEPFFSKEVFANTFFQCAFNKIVFILPVHDSVLSDDFAKNIGWQVTAQRESPKTRF